MEPRIWLIAGPTASGKSALALRLADALGAEIVNADALQLYRDLRVLTARPSAEEERQAPHHLFGTVDAANGWSVGKWVRATTEIIADIHGRGRTAIVVGGTGLYFNALTQGLAEAPTIPPELRAEAAADYDRLGEPAFRARLAEVDPAAAERIATNDRQRLCRAWEVHLATGSSLSELHAASEPALAAGSWRAVALEPPRDGLYDRCDARLVKMIDEGALDEVRALAARDLDPSLPALKAVGYREFAAHLRGEMSLDDALGAAQQETRRYVKRQLTWMRGRMADWPRLTAADADAQWRQFLPLEPRLTA